MITDDSPPAPDTTNFPLFPDDNDPGLNAVYEPLRKSDRISARSPQAEAPPIPPKRNPGMRLVNSPLPPLSNQEKKKKNRQKLTKFIRSPIKLRSRTRIPDDNEGSEDQRPTLEAPIRSPNRPETGKSPRYKLRKRKNVNN